MLADLVPWLKAHGVGILNAAPFAARLLSSSPLPSWHKATAEVRRVAHLAAEHCRARGTDIGRLALQFSIAHPDLTTCVTGSANPDRVAQWAQWASEPLDKQLLSEVRAILRPIHNWFSVEGRAENNDAPYSDAPYSAEAATV